MKNRKEMGDLYETIASEFLMKHGYSIIYMNYRRSFGEIDIIAEKDSVIHFIEVKSVSRVTLEKGIKPEDHVTREKISKISQTAQYFLNEHDLFDTKCQIDLITILSPGSNYSDYYEEGKSNHLVSINYFENIH